MSRVRIHIDQVSLRGLDPAQRNGVMDALRAELKRIAPSAGESAVKSRRIPVVKLGRVPLNPGSPGGKTIGTGIAQAIGKSLKR
ncbi:MAG TPA: hypothetical protein VGL42_14775 [Opitutaceae bacterium]